MVVKGIKLVPGSFRVKRLESDSKAEKWLKTMQCSLISSVSSSMINSKAWVTGLTAILAHFYSNTIKRQILPLAERLESGPGEKV